MSEDESDQKFERFLAEIVGGKENFGDDERNIIDSWLSKFQELTQKDVRNEYAQTLAKFVNDEKRLSAPFDNFPPDGNLLPLTEDKQKKFQIKKVCMPANTAARGSGVIPKTKKATERNLPQYDLYTHNEYEDPEEMAKAVSRSKGQSFAEFVGSISRHTSDFGQGMRQAMKIEMTSFRDYVDHVLSQRIKDLTEVLDDEQNRELQRIKRDTERWQIELSHVKKRIKDIIPGFDYDAYKKDKNYFKKLFTVDLTNMPPDDSFKLWKEETFHRLKWISDMVAKVTRCNEHTCEEISNIEKKAEELEFRETTKHQNLIRFINSEISNLQRLKCERDCIQNETVELQNQLQNCH